MRYYVKDTDYTDCDPVIAECLKSGKQIKCRCYDTNEIEGVSVWVFGYRAKEKYCYITDIRHFSFAHPIIKKRKAKTFTEIAKWLDDNNYICNGKGEWEYNQNTTLPAVYPHKPIYPMYLFCYCGREISTDNQYFPDEWLSDSE